MDITKDITKIKEITEITQLSKFHEYDTFRHWKIVWHFVSLQVWHFTSCKILYDTLHHYGSMTQYVWHKKYYRNVTLGHIVHQNDDVL